MRLVRILFLCVPAAVALACGGSTTRTEPNGTEQSSLVEYKGGCTPDSCNGLPVPLIACAPPAETTTVCAPAGGGTCEISIACGEPEGGPPMCPAGSCGPPPLLGPTCEKGSVAIYPCVDTGSGCVWQPQCVPPSSRDCSPADCGPKPAIAILCEDAATGTLVCEATHDGSCAWTPVCGPAGDGGGGGGEAGEVDGGQGSPGSPPGSDAGLFEGGGFDAAEWRDAIGL